MSRSTTKFVCFTCFLLISIAFAAEYPCLAENTYEALDPAEMESLRGGCPCKRDTSYYVRIDECHHYNVPNPTCSTTMCLMSFGYTDNCIFAPPQNCNLTSGARLWYREKWSFPGCVSADDQWTPVVLCRYGANCTPLIIYTNCEMSTFCTGTWPPMEAWYEAKASCVPS